MRYINSADKEVLNTVNFMCKFPDKTELFISELKNAYEQNSESAEDALAYGLYLLCTRFNNAATIQDLAIESITEAFNRALDLVPDYWIARTFKAIMLLALPEIMQDEQGLVESLEILIKQQNEAAEKKPYFIVPYVVFADYKYSCGDRKGANEILQLGMETVPQTPIMLNCVHDYFLICLESYMKRLIRSNEFEMALQVQHLGKQYFPSEEIFHSDIRQGWM